MIDMLSDLLWGGLCIFLDGILSVIEAFVGSISVGSLATTTLAAWGALPSQLVWFINTLGLPDALAIVGSAYGIRFLLNLIPSSITRI